LIVERSESDYALSEEAQLVQGAVREFATDVVLPRAEAIDHDDVHPEDLVANLAELGLFGVLAKAESGGADLGYVAHAIAVEETARASAAVSAILVAQAIVVETLTKAGGRDALVAELASGAKLGTPAFLEADDGALATEADSDGPEARLTGKKRAAPFPGRSGVYVAVAKTPGGGRAMYLIESGASGLKHDAREATLGLHGFETAALELSATPAARLGGEDLVRVVRDGVRIATAALFAGIGRGAVADATRYAQERRQFDRPIFEFPAVKERLARADRCVAAARALVYDAARLRDRGVAHRLAAARARAFASDAATTAADDALQVYGGYGYSREYPIERRYRDARFVGFGEGRRWTLVDHATEALR
jgi:acyl-CoA dehydrogenase